MSISDAERIKALEDELAGVRFAADQHLNTVKLQKTIIARFTEQAPIQSAGAAEFDIAKALRKAYNFGQTYWQQADSDSYSQSAKSFDTAAKFAAFVEECQAALAVPATAPTVQGALTLEQVEALATVIGNFNRPEYLADEYTVALSAIKSLKAGLRQTAPTVQSATPEVDRLDAITARRSEQAQTDREAFEAWAKTAEPGYHLFWNLTSTSAQRYSNDRAQHTFEGFRAGRATSTPPAQASKDAEAGELPPFPECEIIDGYRAHDPDGGAVNGYSAEQMRDFVLADRAALARSPVQVDAEAGELTQAYAWEFARQLRMYLLAFAGQNFTNTENVDRMNLGQALDHLEEAAAMIMNLADRAALKSGGV